MGQARRRSPGAMPSSERVNRSVSTLRVPCVVAGSRGGRPTRHPDFDVHGTCRVSGALQLDAVRDRHLIIFTHGYNVTPAQALESAVDFFDKLTVKLEREQRSLDDFCFMLFTWPGDVGPLWFSAAQRFAQHSGVALYRLVTALAKEHAPKRMTLVTHSLGAHVGLRGASILGERLFRGKGKARFDAVLMLAPAVEDDVFERPRLLEEYHFPDAPFGMASLHMVVSRADEVLQNAFFVSEFDKALGFAGPETMKPLVSMTRRVREVLGEGYEFQFELHDFSPKSTTILNPNLHAHDHSDYWARDEQVSYYANCL